MDGVRTVVLSCALKLEQPILYMVSNDNTENLLRRCGRL